MSEQHPVHATHPHTDNPEVRHETSDINIRGVLIFGAALGSGTVIIGFLVYLLFGYFNARADRAAAPQFPLAASQAARVPPEPRLQTAPRQDLADLRAKEDEALNSYGWVDKNAGVVRIPIEQAMKLTVERGLPAQQPASGKR